MAFNEEICEILSPFIKNYQEAGNVKKQKEVINDAAEAVKESRQALEEDGDSLPKNLTLAITRYIKGITAKEEEGCGDEEPKPKILKQVYTSRDIIKQHYGSLVNKEIPYEPNDKGYLGSYQRAVTTVLRNMDEEELDIVENLVEEWNKNGPPPEHQRKTARTKLPRDMKKKLEEWKFGSGAMIMCLVVYPDGVGAKSFHMETTPITGNAFTHSHPDWNEGTYEKFKEWSSKQFGLEEQDTEEEADVPVHFQKAKSIVFEKNSKGHFILPKMQNFKTTKQRQRVIRGYIGAVYRQFTGTKNAAFPYLLASEENQTIYSKDSVPNNFCLSDPDHLTAEKINLLYIHMYLRQAKKLPPFVVLNPGPLHGRATQKSEKSKGKKKMEYVHVSTDGEESDEEEEEVDHGEMAVSLATKFGPPAGRSGTNAAAVDEEGEEVDSEEMAVPLATKFGPPAGRSRMNAADIDKGVAGPSFSTLPKQILNERKGEDGDSMAADGGKGQSTGNLTKRKRSDGEPKRRNKHAKANDGSKLGKKGDNLADDHPSLNEKGKKRKRLEDPDMNGNDMSGKEDSNPRKKLAKTIPKTKDRSPPPKPLTKREASRIRDFPSGNVATSASRIAFLRSLCKINKFSSLVETIPIMPKPSPKPSDYPPWASWKSDEVYLPAGFHRSKYVDGLLEIVERDLGNQKILESGKIDATLLLLGLIYREANRCMEVEPGAPSHLPQHLVDSTLGIREVKRIEKLLNGLKFP